METKGAPKDMAGELCAVAGTNPDKDAIVLQGAAGACVAGAARIAPDGRGAPTGSAAGFWWADVVYGQGAGREFCRVTAFTRD